VVLLLTLGTGIGSALFSDGVLVPNTELGHLVIDGVEAEHFASDLIRKRESLDWPQWSARLSKVLQTYHRLWWPDLIILGGGVSKRHASFVHLLEVDVPVVPAQLQNRAGIVGAAAAVV
jgi:Transcriptional regulator/sugar kinase